MEPDTGGAAGPEEPEVSKAVGSHEGTRRDRRPRIDAPSSEDEAQNFLRHRGFYLQVNPWKVGEYSKF